MQRLVMMTGHTQEQGRLVLPDDVTHHLRLIVRSAQGAVMPGLFVTIERPVLSGASLLMQDGAALIRIRQGDDCAGLALAQCVVCWDADMAEIAWQMALELQHIEGLPLAGYPSRPLNAPWFAVIIPPTIAGAKAGVVELLGDLGRCLAWTVMEAPALDDEARCCRLSSFVPTHPVARWQWPGQIMRRECH